MTNKCRGMETGDNGGGGVGALLYFILKWNKQLQMEGGKDILNKSCLCSLQILS